MGLGDPSEWMALAGAEKSTARVDRQPGAAAGATNRPWRRQAGVLGGITAAAAGQRQSSAYRAKATGRVVQRVAGKAEAVVVMGSVAPSRARTGIVRA
jgi:hypothetical protein